MATLTSAAPIFNVRSVEQALERYRRLGFRCNAYDDAGVHGAAIYGFMDRDGVEFHLCRVPDLDPRQNNAACYLYVDDADALRAEWEAAGVEGTLHPAQDTPYDLREFAYVDPDGNLLRIGSQLG